MRSSIPVEPPSAPPQSPEEELASFQILDGFQVNLFASEADGVVKPIQMRWDERGRLWVACAVSYPQIKPGEKANDYVLVCEDTDGDGKADKFHKFVEGLFMPAGIELGDGGLYVAQGTELLHFKDTDGDDKADTKRIVLGGFGTADSHQMINCINWGFGGELWFTQGHHIYSRVETPYGVETLNRAGVWRYRPRTGHLDPFFQWSSAGANCWGVVTTEYGQPFHKSGANIGSPTTRTPGLVRSDLAVNAQAMNLCLAPIKQVGMEFLHSSMFPAEMQGRVIIGGYYANLLEWHELKLRERPLQHDAAAKHHRDEEQCLPPCRGAQRPGRRALCRRLVQSDHRSLSGQLSPSRSRQTTRSCLACELQRRPSGQACQTRRREHTGAAGAVGFEGTLGLVSVEAPAL
jgi:hypothetical protein